MRENNELVASELVLSILGSSILVQNFWQTTSFFSYFVLPVSVIFFFKLTVNVTNLPPTETNNSYKCLIDGKERPTSTLPGGKLACRTPTSDQLPKIKSDTGIGASDLGRGTTPRGPALYPFIYHDKKVTPFIYLLMSNGTPFTLPS